MHLSKHRILIGMCMGCHITKYSMSFSTFTIPVIVIIITPLQQKVLCCCFELSLVALPFLLPFFHLTQGKPKKEYIFSWEKNGEEKLYTERERETDIHTYMHASQKHSIFLHSLHHSHFHSIRQACTGKEKPMQCNVREERQGA